MEAHQYNIKSSEIQSFAISRAILIAEGNNSIIDVKTNVSGDHLEAKLKNLLETLPLAQH